jgi:hypothetical protein
VVTRRAALAGAAVVLALALAAVAVARAQGAARAVPADLSVVAMDGRAVTFGAGVTHLVFAARWCGPCEPDVRALRRSVTSGRREGYESLVVGVSRRQSREEFSDWARALGFDGGLVFDDGGRLEKALGAAVLPWHVVIGADRRILWSSDRAPDPAAVRSWVAGKP